MPTGYQSPFLQGICLYQWFVLARKGFLCWLPPDGNLCIPSLANADAHGVCQQQRSFPVWEIVRVGKGCLLVTKYLSVPCGYNNVLILVK